MQWITHTQQPSQPVSRRPDAKESAVLMHGRSSWMLLPSHRDVATSLLARLWRMRLLRVLLPLVDVPLAATKIGSGCLLQKGPGANTITVATSEHNMGHVAYPERGMAHIAKLSKRFRCLQSDPNMSHFANPFEPTRCLQRECNTGHVVKPSATWLMLQTLNRNWRGSNQTAIACGIQ